MKSNIEKIIDNVFRCLSIISIIVSIFGVKYAKDANNIAKEANDTSKKIAITGIESQKSEAKLVNLQTCVISLENIRSKIDVIEKKEDLSDEDYSHEDYKKDIENLDLIYNSIRTNINRKNKFASKLEEKFNFEIDKLRSNFKKIDFNANSKSNNGLRKRMDSLANTGSITSLEDIFSDYEKEENDLILKELQKNK